ncbi:hypothetical protein ACFSHR_11640 [Azotobacter chroococcum]
MAIIEAGGWGTLHASPKWGNKWGNKSSIGLKVKKLRGLQRKNAGHKPAFLFSASRAVRIPAALSLIAGRFLMRGNF